MPLMPTPRHNFLGQDDSGVYQQSPPSPDFMTWMQQQFIAGIPNWVLVGGFLWWTFTKHRGGVRSEK
jgi:hypothetical protein